jgi:hypothetical protein
MGYNKPITARIQHSTNKGMKAQDPLLDMGSPAKELNYGADTSLMGGKEHSKFIDARKIVGESVDKGKSKIVDETAKSE